jgi:predicted enzyme related to lactoylglutathione lyase
MTRKFCRYDLRTTDVDASKTFYGRLFGHDRAVIWPLHEQARARGAVPHWLGSIMLEDLPALERASADLAARGGAILGGPFPTRDGGHAAVLRDPAGAITGLATHPQSECAAAVDVAWHVLSAKDLDAAKATYRDVFGWTIGGAFHEFRWDETQGGSDGAMWDVASRPEIHPHWLFFFEVDSLDGAIALTRSEGGTAMAPILTPAGKRVAVCEDPQGAAFGIAQR